MVCSILIQQIKENTLGREIRAILGLGLKAQMARLASPCDTHLYTSNVLISKR